MSGGRRHKVHKVSKSAFGESNLGWCDEHGKWLFTSRKAAKKANHRMHKSGLREYPCTAVADAWHLGHIPQATLYGIKTLDEVRKARGV